MIGALAQARGYGFADYAAGRTDSRGLVAAGLNRDGIHPLAAGYARMAPVVEQTIAAGAKAQG